MERHPSSWDVRDVCNWVEVIGFPQYRRKFSHNRWELEFRLGTQHCKGMICHVFIVPGAPADLLWWSKEAGWFTQVFRKLPHATGQGASGGESLIQSAGVGGLHFWQYSIIRQVGGSCIICQYCNK